MKTSTTMKTILLMITKMTMIKLMAKTTSQKQFNLMVLPQLEVGDSLLRTPVTMMMLEARLGMLLHNNLMSPCL
jgi:hypothetical protein